MTGMSDLSCACWCVGIRRKQVDSHGSSPCRMEQDSREEGQCVVPGPGIQNTVDLKLLHHHHSLVVRKENVKTSEGAKLPKGSLKSHKFCILREVKLNFGGKKIVLLSKSREGENKYKAN